MNEPEWKLRKMRYLERDRANAKKYRTSHPDRVQASKNAWRKKNPERSRVSQLKTTLKTLYGITLEEYNTMQAAQGFVCAICKSERPNNRYRWFVDHCHTSKKVRGLLCQKCNTLLGCAGDSTLILQAAIAYLENTP